MDNRRYDYSPIIRRPKIEWPEHGRIALWVAPNIEYFHYDMPIRGSGSNHTPDVPGYTLRDYGSRVGVYRIMEVLDKHGMRASVLLNAEVCEKHPPIIEEGSRLRRAPRLAEPLPLAMPGDATGIPSIVTGL